MKIPASFYRISKPRKKWSKPKFVISNSAVRCFFVLLIWSNVTAYDNKVIPIKRNKSGNIVLASL